MDSGRKSRYGSDKDAGSGRGTQDPAGVGVGKQTLAQSIAGSSGKGKGQAQGPKEKAADPAAEGKDGEDKDKKKKKDKQPGEAGEANEKEEEGAEKDAEGAEGAEGEGKDKEGEGEGKEEGDGEGKEEAEGSGEGFSEMLGDMARGAVDGALAGAGIPSVRIKTQEASPSGVKDRTQVGVGETVEFSSNMPGKWKCDKIAPGFQKTGSGDQFVWFAPETKGKAKITFDAGKKGVKPVEIEMKILEPIVDYLNPRAVSFPTQAPGAMGVNMETDVTYLPLDVSFANTMWWEKPGPASNAKGYFADHVSKRGFQLPFHNPAADDLQINNKNSGITDTAGWWDFNPPYYAGSFEWVIPTYYRVLDGARHLIKNVHQKASMDDAGTLTVTKESGTLSRAI